MTERNLVAVSIKHSIYGWLFGKPLCLWGHRTADNEKRSFGGYTQYPGNAEVYSLKEWQESGYAAGDIIKVNEPVHLEVKFCKRWKNYDTVLVPYDEIVSYYKVAGLAINRPKEEA